MWLELFYGNGSQFSFEPFAHILQGRPANQRTMKEAPPILVAGQLLAERKSYLRRFSTAFWRIPHCRLYSLFLFFAKKTKGIESLRFVGVHQLFKVTLAFDGVQVGVSADGRIIIETIFESLGQIRNGLPHPKTKEIKRNKRTRR